MKFRAVTYKTLKGTQEVVKPNKKTSTQWVIYQHNKPTYFVDAFNLQIESNAIMNSLVLCSKRSIQEVLTLINKKNNVSLYIPKISHFALKGKTKTISLELPPLPEEWLDYSL